MNLDECSAKKKRAYTKYLLSQQIGQITYILDTMPLSRDEQYALQLEHDIVKGMLERWNDYIIEEDNDD